MINQDYFKSFLQSLILEAESNDIRSVEEVVQKIVTELEETLVHS